MVLTRSNILKMLKNLSNTSQLAKDASEKLEALINTVFLPRLISTSAKIALNRHGGKRKILKEDIETALFGILTFTLFTGADNQGKHGRIHIVSGSAIRSLVISQLENDRQYQKLPTQSVVYLRGVIDFLTKYILSQAIVRSKVEDESKRLTADHITLCIAKNDDLLYIFPNVAITYWKKQYEINNATRKRQV